MGYEYYIFTAFVFVLLCVLLFLYRRFVVLPKGKKTGGEDEDRGREKEARLFRLYQNIEEMMDNFEGYVEDARSQMEEIKAGMAQQEQRINELIRRAEDTQARAQAAVDTARAPDRQPKHEGQPEAGKPADARRTGKQDAVRELLSKGMTVEQIAQKLELSINEVRLVVYGLMSRNADKK